MEEEKKRTNSPNWEKKCWQQRQKKYNHCIVSPSFSLFCRWRTSESKILVIWSAWESFMYTMDFVFLSFNFIFFTLFVLIPIDCKMLRGNFRKVFFCVESNTEIWMEFYWRFSAILLMQFRLSQLFILKSKKKKKIIILPYGKCFLNIIAMRLTISVSEKRRCARLSIQT